MIISLTFGLRVLASILLFSTTIFWGISSPSQPLRSWKLLHEADGLHTIEFNDLRFFDRNNGIANTVFDIKRTKDGGRTWETILEKDGQSIYSMVFSGKNVGLLVGSDENQPKILKTIDGGHSWETVNFDRRPIEARNKKFTKFFDVCLNGNKMWIASDGGILGGRIFENSLEISTVWETEESINSIACSESGQVVAVSSEGGIYDNVNGWYRKKVGREHYFSRVRVYKNVFWILGVEGDVGSVLRSTDLGESWTDVTPLNAKELFDISFEGANGLLVGDAGKIYSSNDKGYSWQEAESPTKNALYRIFTLDSSDQWISGDKMTILRRHPLDNDTLR